MQEDEAVGHAGDVVGDDAGEAFGLHLFEVAMRELFRLFDPVVEERGDDLFGLVVLDLELATGVESVVEVALFLQALGLGQRGEDSEALGVVAYVFEAMSAPMAAVLRRVVAMRSSVRMFCMSCRASLKRNFSSTPACCFSTAV